MQIHFVVLINSIWSDYVNVLSNYAQLMLNAMVREWLGKFVDQIHFSSGNASHKYHIQSINQSENGKEKIFHRFFCSVVFANSLFLNLGGWQSHKQGSAIKKLCIKWRSLGVASHILNAIRHHNHKVCCKPEKEYRLSCTKEHDFQFEVVLSRLLDDATNTAADIVSPALSASLRSTSPLNFYYVNETKPNRYVWYL